MGNALGGIPVFSQKSAEVVEGDALRFGGV